GNCTGTPVAPATTGNDVCANLVPATTADPQTQQHMTTYTVGLGVRGRMVYGPPTEASVPRGYNYVTAGSGDYYDVAHGTTAGGGICSWQASGACNWPVPGITGSDGNIENVDDLWHAAVNGHGYYYSATDANSLVTALQDFAAKIPPPSKPGTAAAAASSNPNVTSNDNYVFSSSYTPAQWFGEVIMQRLDTKFATLSDNQWDAGALLAQKMQASDTTKRTIYFNNGGLKDFTWANLSAAQQAYFKAPSLTYTSATSGLSQFCSSSSSCLSATAQSTTTAPTGAAGENLVKYLRGDHTNEGKFYRVRPCATYSAVSGAAYLANADHPEGTCVWFTNGVRDDAGGAPQPYVLGDIVSSEARYVKLPQFQYTADGYGTFVAQQASRAGMLYVGANDGMLHAFNALTGDETWAYIPSAVLPNLYKLADMNYADNHQFYVDGTPEVGDIYDGTNWKTVLVGGLNLGGKSFYALDITDPASPIYKWEFTDANMGYSFGNPKFGKLTDGTWVVLLTSGYNNADGKGHLYVVNANTGALIRDISTGVGTAASPSGLARIAVRLTSVADPTILAVYGGDLLGNVWRFDVNNNIGASGYEAQLLVTLKDASGNVQPITAKPTVAMIGDIPVVYVGTGEFLGVSDIGTTTQQSFYAIKDKLDTTTFGNPRVAANKFVHQTVSEMACPAAQVTAGACASGETVRGISGSDCHAVDWSVDNGWYVDFMTLGERSYTDSTLALGSLVFTTNIPNQTTSSGDACVGGGSSSIKAKSFRYTQDYATGCSVKGTDSVVGIDLGAGLATRPNPVMLPDGKMYSITRKSDPDKGPETLIQNFVTAPS
ncbi:MAG: PilC/PilY family type IV pilus protein, partial [Comamonadaceae bacterium]